jgi:multidrug efflux pump subunit AcrA (membrane-fusion protein)
MSYPRAACLVVVLLAARFASAQVSVEEAQRRLRERTATAPAATQPVGELARVTEENRKLRVRVGQLEAEIQTLRTALAAQKTAATQPAGDAPVQDHVSIAGGWRGGDINRGSGYVLEFAADGTYRRTFLSYNKRETGQYHFTASNVVELLADSSAEGGERNAYRVSVDGNSLTLTPVRVNGADIANGRPMVLTRG